ncbi:MAG: polyhydroxyalkanoate synthesis repressor PhaR [Aquincola sp.]|nr:polyhydroxyalkanoate synthesis repressor PhaR [Aquincola sp.]MDH4288467.1 polyhydroxyalkanoate synthesis repressor PhaR [Aquincola sp.]MDH5329959.1 polyhydroxyalkanoate synthesis repressor PhaR [Aquincola sp.]
MTRRRTQTGNAESDAAAASVRVLKKYPNRRLYDTQSSSYITLADVKRMVLDGEDFEVRDAKSGEDLTRSILLQIILEEESAGVPMFSTETLSQIIRFYGHTMQGAMGAWFEQNMKAFADMQGRMLGGTASPVPNLVGSYLEQSQKLFAQMQEQAGALFPGFVPPKK